jgi:hypothetical protein
LGISPSATGLQDWLWAAQPKERDRVTAKIESLTRDFRVTPEIANPRCSNPRKRWQFSMKSPLLLPVFSAILIVGIVWFYHVLGFWVYHMYRHESERLNPR